MRMVYVVKSFEKVGELVGDNQSCQVFLRKVISLGVVVTLCIHINNVLCSSGSSPLQTNKGKKEQSQRRPYSRGGREPKRGLFWIYLSASD